MSTKTEEVVAWLAFAVWLVLAIAMVVLSFIGLVAVTL